MQLAVVLYEGATALDAVVPYEVLSRLAGIEPVFVAERLGPVRCDRGALALVADATFDEVPHPAIIVVPGGRGRGSHTANGPMHRWLRLVDRTSAWTASVCTGSLILAAAGPLKGRRAAATPPLIGPLTAFGAVPAADRLCLDGKYVSAAGLSAGIDMSLMLAARIAGPPAAHEVRLGLQYAPHPIHAS